MKKKAIAEIPYMTAKRAGKKYRYVAVQNLREIKGEEHLLVEIFENTKDGRKLPKLRIVLTKKDWCLYHPKEDVWSSAGIRDEYGCNIWESSVKKEIPRHLCQERTRMQCGHGIAKKNWRSGNTAAGQIV